MLLEVVMLLGVVCLEGWKNIFECPFKRADGSKNEP